MNKAQKGFFEILKNCHRTDPPFEVLLWSCWLIDSEVVAREGKYDIWKEGNILFTGTYEQLLDDLFFYIFDTKDNE